MQPYYLEVVGRKGAWDRITGTHPRMAIVCFVGFAPKDVRSFWALVWQLRYLLFSLTRLLPCTPFSKIGQGRQMAQISDLRVGQMTLRYHFVGLGG